MAPPSVATDICVTLVDNAVPSNVEDQVLELSFDLSSDVMGTDVFLQSLQVIAADGSLYRADLADVHVTLAPQEYSLAEPYPNPFNPAVQIDYALPPTQARSRSSFTTSLGRRCGPSCPTGRRPVSSAWPGMAWMTQTDRWRVACT